MNAPQAQKRKFAAAYLRTMDPWRAAAEAGLTDGTAALRDRDVRKLLDRMREDMNSQICREDAVRRLCELAFGRANDTVRLALDRETDIEKLDLAAAAELKTKGDGTIEVKFIDRVRALEALCSLLDQEADGAAELLHALREAGAEAR